MLCIGTILYIPPKFVCVGGGGVRGIGGAEVFGEEASLPPPTFNR